MGLIESILLGASLGAIPGPIFFETVRRTLKNGFWSGALLSVGEFFAYILILILVYFGLQRFVSIPEVKTAFFLMGGLVLLLVGASAFRGNARNEKRSFLDNSVLAGFAIAISSPIAIVFWASVGSAQLARYSAKAEALENIIAMAFGVMLFFFCFAGAIQLARKKLQEKHIALMSKFFGFVLVLYGAYFIYQFGASALKP